MVDSDSDEDFVVYGTPRNIEGDDLILAKRQKTLGDQVVKDKQGRRRFHGAFTGGFSAGFFNSVGSAEGWTPSTFKSSRSTKAGNHSQKPEDFMDDEDVGEFGFAPRVMQVKDDYEANNEQRVNKRKRLGFEGHQPVQDILKSILKPVRSTVGVHLLKKMGWRVGQGVGPRLSKREKKQQRQEISQRVKVYGCSLPSSNIAEGKTGSGSDGEGSYSSSDAEDADSITFAPSDYDPYVIKAKSDYFGIGYTGLDRRPVLSKHFTLFEPPVTEKGKSKKLIQGKGFGVGALEDEDEDIYDTEDMSDYDFSLESKASTSRWDKKTPKAICQSNETIEGFVAANKTVQKKIFPPPKLPPGFQPIHVVKKSRFEPKKGDSKSDSKNRGLDRHGITASERSVLIGEAVHDSQASEPAVICGPSNKETEGTSEVPGSISVKSYSDGIFRPFAAYPDKQKRYEQFLTLAKNKQKDKLSALQPLSMTDWERERERLEFEQASKLYQPISAAFSDRFVTATRSDDSTDPLVEVQRTVDNQKDRREAAKRKMFGSLTRKVNDWAPDGLLCKRFNIPNPNVREIDIGKSKRPKFSVFNFLEAATHNVYKTADEPLLASTEVSEVQDERKIEVPKQIKENSPEAAEDGSKKTLEIEELASKEDLYKAIFLSSSDESEDEDDKVREMVETTTTWSETPSTAPRPKTVEPSAADVNVLRNTSPPRGIFANLDLDAINKRNTDRKPVTGDVSKKVEDEPEKKIEIRTVDSEESTNNEGDMVSSSINEDTDIYGPKLPSTPLPRIDKISYKTSIKSKKVSDEKWVESIPVKKSKKHHKEKSKKSKSQHKHKKSKKHKR